MKERDVVFGQGKKLLGKLSRYKYIFFIILAGVLLLALPTTEEKSRASGQCESALEEDFSVEALEQKLADTLSEIDGAGQVRVMLTVESGMKRVFAQDGNLEQEKDAIYRETQTVVVSTGSGKQETVLVQQVYPTFQGALVVASGGGDPAVRLKLTEAVAALTGLGTDKISICKGK